MCFLLGFLICDSLVAFLRGFDVIKIPPLIFSFFLFPFVLDLSNLSVLNLDFSLKNRHRDDLLKVFMESLS